MTREQLLKKYPQYKDNMHNEPKHNCKWCHGTGEYNSGEHGIIPCICVFKDHNQVEESK